ncbi:GNAT family N-acetyltransferase [Flaviaesturariibacter aridisoli]|uniref:GNAT family N-acetyltransferase n=1 Tax=Flaviaesturariibacter aridisoli TaxID=2545761 RepID=A0A4R4E5Z7_9BACT|nr:GNAT family N-acetyltransferase [Flaviaesturariibacter aridisoli]TCZ74180.1 GNAT family N-acetyltransferase [Flaviaesturariibacter aridisoli]
MIQPDNLLPYAHPSVPGGIQQPGTHDFQEILDVWENSVRATHYFLKEADILLFRALIPQYLELVDLYCTRDATGAISGFLGVAAAKIEMLFIRPDQRGLGIGGTLLSFALHRLGLRRVDVNEQNTQACAFYRHAGFTETGRSDKDGMGMPYPLLHFTYDAGTA